ncbi:MAG: endonuclease/exonuclease/phosphatase family protein [Muribaculaceae bacterium]|nr:endonuclease/exonuclease/phosphatase family protein [Muribaculaceae bacterium]
MRLYFNIAKYLFIVLLMGAFLMGAWGGKLNPSVWGPLPELFVLAFPLTLAISFLVLVVVLIRKSFVAALLLGACFVASIPMISTTFARPSLFRGKPSMIDPVRTIKVMSYNVHGFNAEDHRVRNRNNITMEAIIKQDADVVALQEAVYYGWNYADVPSIKPMLDTLRSMYPYRTDSRSDKVTLFSKYPFTTTELVHNQVKNTYGKLVKRTDACAYQISLPNNKSITLVNGYLSSYLLNHNERSLLTLTKQSKGDSLSLFNKFEQALSLRVRQTEQIATFIKNNPGNIIMCCDMNDVPGSYCYRLLIDAGLNDAFAEQGNGYLHTFNHQHYLFHLDHILYRGDLKPVHFERHKIGISDHYPITATFVVE